jgi:hypothetical protein
MRLPISQFNFYSKCVTGLFLYNKFGLQEMLSSGGIQISNGKEYALSDVIDTIKHAFGGSPQIVCKRGSVEELRLCFDKELKVSSPFPLECLPRICCYEILWSWVE